MLIDTHQHVFWHGRDDAGLIRDMDDHGVDRAWLLTWEIGPGEDEPRHHRILNPENRRRDGTQGGIVLADLIRARDRYPDRFVLGYCPHPLMGDAPALLEEAYHMHGVRVCGEWKCRLLFDDPRCLNLFTKAGELGCPVVLHLDVPYLPDAETGKSVYQPSWYGGTVANLERALQACPETQFIGHAPGFWREISADADTQDRPYPAGPVPEPGRLYRLLDRYGNLWADLSAGSGRLALQRDPDHAVQFLDRYQDRLLFARDYYGGDLMAFLRTLDLSPTIQNKIEHHNARRLLPERGWGSSPFT